LRERSSGESWTLTNVALSACTSDGMTMDYKTAAPAAASKSTPITRSNISNN